MTIFHDLFVVVSLSGWFRHAFLPPHKSRTQCCKVSKQWPPWESLGLPKAETKPGSSHVLATLEWCSYCKPCWITKSGFKSLSHIFTALVSIHLFFGRVDYKPTVCTISICMMGNQLIYRSVIPHTAILYLKALCMKEQLLVARTSWFKIFMCKPYSSLITLYFSGDFMF